MFRSGPPATGASTRSRVLQGLALTVALGGFVLAWGWIAAPLRIGPRPDSTQGFGPEAIARRAEAAFVDADATMRADLPGAEAADFVLFREATSSACAAGTTGRGAFYCPETGQAALDLDYLERLSARTAQDAETAIALVAGRIAAEHRQRESGVLDSAALDMIGASKERRAEIGLALALQGDCLTGAWAHAGLGALSKDIWRKLLFSARNVGADLTRAGRPIPQELDVFATGAADARAAAFAHGYAAASVTACPAPVTLALR